MIVPTQNIPINIEVAILGNTGKFETGLSVDYEVRKVSDDSVLTSGTATEASGVYYFTYTFTVVEEYRLQWITPIGYEDGLENIVVQNLPKDVITELDTSAVDVAVRLQNVATVDTTGNQLAALP